MKKKEKEDFTFNNKIIANPKLNEDSGKTAVITFGRFNPPTTGHQKLVDKIKEVARRNNATPMVFLSQTNDPKKNPLEYTDKIMLAQKAFGNIVKKSRAKTLINVLAELSGKYDDIIIVVGQDRVQEFDRLTSKYNGKDYEFDSIEVVSAGDRDPDAEDVTGMSASKMRAAAAKDDFTSFAKGLPTKLKNMADDVFDMVRAGMQLAEELEAFDMLTEATLTLAQRKQRARTMRRYKSKIAAARRRLRKRKASPEKLKLRAQKQARNILKRKLSGGKEYGEMTPSEKMIVDKKLEKRQAAIKRLATRMLPKVRKAEIARLQAVQNESLDEGNLTAKEKEKREAHFERTAKMSPNDPKAYEQPSVDRDIETRPSKHTKRYHKMFTKENKMNFDKRFKLFRKNGYQEISENYMEALEKKSEETGVSVSILKQVYDRGLAAYRTSHRPGATQHQWAMARVNSFLTGGPTQKTTDKDLWDKVKKQ